MGLCFILSAILGALLKIPLTGIEVKYLCLTFFAEIYITIGYLGIAAGFILLTRNSALSLFILILFSVIIPVAVEILQGLPFMMKYHPERLLFDHLVYRAVTDFTFVMDMSGFLWMLFSGLIYIGGVLFLTIFIFDRKELDF